MNTPIGNTSFDYRYVSVKDTIVKRPVQRCNATKQRQKPQRESFENIKYFSQTTSYFTNQVKLIVGNFPGKSTDCRRLAGQLSHDDVRKNDDRKAREVSRGSREFDGRSIPEIGRDDAVDTMESPIYKELNDVGKIGGGKIRDDPRNVKKVCQTQALDSTKSSAICFTKLETTQNSRLHEETTPSSCGIRLMSISTNVHYKCSNPRNRERNLIFVIKIEYKNRESVEGPFRIASRFNYFFGKKKSNFAEKGH
ncbi:hypothetical protein G5I_12559 [Acromyrmex echinatior]|uniref:Uncharacterized protein n=1 Tax=Acromyrmex echinatior TaxID=103372 RepID=F4X2M9_ACREC|nr:hypothetical protein G5I_12559 [Acromyrmex echinatior]